MGLSSIYISKQVPYARLGALCSCVVEAPANDRFHLSRERTWPPSKHRKSLNKIHITLSYRCGCLGWPWPRRDQSHMEAPPCHCPHSPALPWLTLESNVDWVWVWENSVAGAASLLLSGKDTQIIEGWQIANKGNFQTRRHTGFWKELPPLAKPVWHEKE